MKRIPLTQGKYALIDDEDWELISKYKWRLEKNRNSYYATATIPKMNRSIRIHRLIMNAQKGQEIDHISHNGLDNRKHNLRFATIPQNLRNAYKQRNTSSKYKGVCWGKARNKWLAYIYCGKTINLGSYNNTIVAAWVYDQMANKLFKEFARVNFP